MTTRLASWISPQIDDGQAPPPGLFTPWLWMATMSLSAMSRFGAEMDSSGNNSKYPPTRSWPQGIQWGSGQVGGHVSVPGVSLAPAALALCARLDRVDGIHRSSAAAQDKPSAGRREQELIAARCTNVEIIETKPGQLPERLT
ncbi:hypothetical protein [Streptomyces bicolor]|uniref:hypothetical protein n=1 Tax=Streptomyces bicolor TaxID=66874 RepID=UPI001F483F7D|nr:hypothetical protein [Streptomyces bicolor]